MGVVVPFDGGEDREPSIDLIVQLVAKDMARVNEAILLHARSHVDMIPSLPAT